MQDHPHLFEATLDSQEMLRSHFLHVVCDTVRRKRPAIPS